MKNLSSTKTTNSLETPEFVGLNTCIYSYLYMDVLKIVTLDKGFKRLACMP